MFQRPSSIPAFTSDEQCKSHLQTPISDENTCKYRDGHMNTVNLRICTSSGEWLVFKVSTFKVVVAKMSP